MDILDETIELGGGKYRAVVSPIPGKCGDCAFKDGFGCKLAEERILRGGTTECIPEKRPDGRGVYFIPAHKARLYLLGKATKPV